MKCKKIKELILSGYADNEISNENRQKVDLHLAECEKCRQFSEDVSSNIINVLNNATRLEPEVDLWDKIKDRIESGENVSVSKNLKNIFKEIFMIRKPVYAIATLILLMTVTGLFSKFYVNDKKTLDQYLVEQITFVDSLDSATGYENEDIGIPFEIIGI